VVIGHGRSDARAIQSMIQMAEKSARQDLVKAIETELAAARGS
jgi:fatty acid/phospholipid biosynthesis enzyme